MSKLIEEAIDECSQPKTLGRVIDITTDKVIQLQIKILKDMITDAKDSGDVSSETLEFIANAEKLIETITEDIKNDSTK